MQAKMLQATDKLLFVKQLYAYCSRTTNARIKTAYVAQSGNSGRSFADKMCGHREFKGQDLDLVYTLYYKELGTSSFDNQLTLFIQNQSDGDKRTISEQNDEMLTSKLVLQ